MFLVELQRLEDRKIKFLRVPRTRPKRASSVACSLNGISERLSKAGLQTNPTEAEKGLGFVGDVPFVDCSYVAR
jgi:hypothetical protein